MPDSFVLLKRKHFIAILKLQSFFLWTSSDLIKSEMSREVSVDSAQQMKS